MTRRKVTTVDAVELLASTFGVTLKPAGGRTFDVVLPDMQLRVEITMKVHHEAPRADRSHYREAALEKIADPDRGEWTDHCNTSVKQRGHFHLPGATSGCKKPVIGVVVTKHFDQIFYSFRCRCHFERPTSDDTKIVYRDTMKAELDVARAKRQAAINLRARFAAMTPAELVEHDAREIGRNNVADAIRKNERAAFQVDDLVEFTEIAKAENPDSPAAKIPGPWVVRKIEDDHLWVQPEGGIVRGCKAKDVRLYGRTKIRKAG